MLAMENVVPKNPLLLGSAAQEQFGAICYRFNEVTRDLEVLLITTRESHRWAIPKGWAMEGKSPHRVAQQEAREEAGVCGKVSKKPFGHFTYLKGIDNGDRVPCIVQVHLLKAESTLDRYKEQGQREVLWCNCLEAAVKVGEPELKGLFRLLHERKMKLK